MYIGIKEEVINDAAKTIAKINISLNEYPKILHTNKIKFSTERKGSSKCTLIPLEREQIKSLSANIRINPPTIAEKIKHLQYFINITFV